MSREIKFRAWDKVNKVMCGVVVLDLWNLDCDMATTQIYELKSGVGHRRELKNNIELLQYTGLSDKNGTEIFEGDILRNESYPEGCDSVVIFHEGSYHINDDFNGISEYLHEVNECSEVIGTIYEHPELIEKQ